MIPFFSLLLDKQVPGERSGQEWNPEVDQHALGDLCDTNVHNDTP